MWVRHRNLMADVDDDARLSKGEDDSLIQVFAWMCVDQEYRKGVGCPQNPNQGSWSQWGFQAYSTLLCLKVPFTSFTSTAEDLKFSWHGWGCGLGHVCVSLLLLQYEPICIQVNIHIRLDKHPKFGRSDLNTLFETEKKKKGLTLLWSKYIFKPFASYLNMLNLYSA